jgi:UDP-glucose 4-epimerase
VKQIFAELKSILGFQGEPIYDAPRPGEIQRIYLDATRAREVLGWRPRVGFREGLEKTVAWARSEKEAQAKR